MDSIELTDMVVKIELVEGPVTIFTAPMGAPRPEVSETPGIPWVLSQTIEGE